METFSYQLPVKNRLITPPGTPTAGDRYVIDGVGTGAWSGHNMKVAYWAGAAWVFDTPEAGWQCYDEQAGVFIYFDGAHWNEMDITGAYIQQLVAGAITGNVPVWTDTDGDKLSAGYGVQTTIRAHGTADDLHLGTEKAVRDAINAIIGASDAMVYKGAIDCSGNPDYPAGDAGHTYKVSVAGRIGGAAGEKVEVGDMFICLLDTTPAGDQAAVGTRWNVIQVNIDGAVTSSLASSTDGRIAVWDGVSGSVIKDAALTATEISNHIGLADVHFTQAQIDHLLIDNRGTKTHANIDLHIATHSRHRTMTYNSTFKAIIYEEANESF